MRKPINLEETPRFLVVDPYGGKRVNKKYPSYIKRMAELKRIDYCYFPLEPFHYREKKRHATELAMRACVESFLPMSLETRSEVPEWAVDLLTRHKHSRISIQLNTLDKSKWKLLYKDASTPEQLINSFIRCFSGGVYTTLKIAPIVPCVITPLDVFKVVNSARNFIEQIEVCFASFSELDYKKLMKRLPEKYAKTADYYEKVGDRYFVKGKYRKDFLTKLNEFTKGLKIGLKLPNEVIFENGEVIGRMTV